MLATAVLAAGLGAGGSDVLGKRPAWYVASRHARLARRLRSGRPIRHGRTHPASVIGGVRASRRARPSVAVADLDQTSARAQPGQSSEHRGDPHSRTDALHLRVRIIS
jgi:hypothetical protein